MSLLQQYFAVFEPFSLSVGAVLLAVLLVGVFIGLVHSVHKELRTTAEFLKHCEARREARQGKREERARP